jgi:hypothetical protein
MSANQIDISFENEKKKNGPVECLGKTFANESARRAHFLDLLGLKLKDPEFRKLPGFPKGTDEDILRMSDPPFYTACPNPFFSDYVNCYGNVYEPSEPYEREPFAVDVSVGKTDQLYKAHGYHTKVPHLAIVPSILHYTRPGDIVLDGFCGSGMTGLAAQWCGMAPAEYKLRLEAEWKDTGHSAPEWGERRAILNDLGPAASFIAAGYNIPFDVKLFEKEVQRILNEVEHELGWMYEVLHTDGKTKGRMNYTVWSEVFSCPECAGEVNFVSEALDRESGETSSEFPCPHCRTELSKKRLDRFYLQFIDKATNLKCKSPKRLPVLVNYNVGSATYEREVTPGDIEVLSKIDQLHLPSEIPISALPYMHMTHERARMDLAGVTHVHHLYFPRAVHSLSALWRKANAIKNIATQRMVLWFVEQAIWGISLLNRYKEKQFGRTGGSQVNNYMSGIYYVSSVIGECSPWYILHDEAKRSSKLSRLVNSFTLAPATDGNTVIQTGDCASLALPDKSVDYIFTDPPFGENIYYADLNFLVESWHGVHTNATNEAIVDRAKKKGVHEYQELMRRCFNEYYRVLKPGRWMTVVFSNSNNGIWHAIQEAMGVAGFVVADVRTLDKQQGSYRQVTSTAVKQDLIISVYKPTDTLSHNFVLGHTTPEAAWAFVHEHLHNVPVFVGRANEVEVVVERTGQMLFDRMIAFHVQRGIGVPISGSEFLRGISQRFPERDGMYFLPEQVMEYDKKRTTVDALRQLNLFINDEHNVVQWVRQQLQDKPQSFQDLQPQFMGELQTWAKHEKTVELKLVLEQNCLHYDGVDLVPSQIHSYLSSNFKEMRNLEKSDATLKEKAKDRWYVPDPSKQSDLAQLRERALIKEFEEYRASTLRKLKLFRTEAIRLGFRACWQNRDYDTIIKVAEKLPNDVLLEDEKLLMYYDNARTRIGSDG